MRILVVEDSSRLREQLVAALRHSGYAVDAAGDGTEGLWLALNMDFDAAVLDIMLPGLDGLTILRRLREKQRPIPVLLLTALDRVEQRVRGLDTGADDYLVKPFALEELLARVAALCRRKYADPTPTVLIGSLRLDMQAHKVFRDGSEIVLTPREFALLELLARRRGQVITRAEIERHIYDERADPMSNVVDSAICSLRKKLFPADTHPLIQTRRGVGYILLTE
jgi:DNA-binding response OmpR family regulator